MGIRFPLRQGAVRGGLRIATPVCAPVRNDRFFWGVRCKRVVGDADPYEVGKNPVGRGLCAPPLGAQSMSGGGTHGCRPTGTLLRSLKGRGEGTPPYGGRARRCGAWGEYGLPHR